MARFFVAVALFLSVLTLSETVVVEGYGDTLQEAMDDARRNALEQVSGAFVKSVTKVEDFELVKDTVFSTVQGYVKILEVLEKSKEQDVTGEYWRVKAKVEVLEKEIEQRISDLMAEVGEPTVGVMVSETYRGSGECDYTPSPDFFHLLGFSELLADRGLKIQEIGALAAYNEKLKSYGVGEKDLQDIASVAKDVASYVIAVKVDYTGRYNSYYGVCSVSMRADVKIVRTDTGKSFGRAFKETYASSSPEKAIEWILRSRKSKANLSKIADEVAKMIYVDRTEYALNPKNIRVRLEIPDLSWVSKVMELFENVPDVINVTRQKVTTSSVILALRTYHTPEKLWEVLKENLKSDLDMELLSISGDTIYVKVNGIIGKFKREVVLKFKIDKLSTGVKIKKCLKNFKDATLLGTVERSKEMFSFKVETELDPEDLMVEIEDMECDVEISAEDIAEDGSWILFSAKRR